MDKKIIGLTALLTLCPINVSAVEIPERFKNYKEKATLTDTRPLQTQNGIFCCHRYDLDGDKLADVMEMYSLLGKPNHL